MHVGNSGRRIRIQIKIAPAETFSDGAVSGTQLHRYTYNEWKQRPTSADFHSVSFQYSKLSPEPELETVDVNYKSHLT